MILWKLPIAQEIIQSDAAQDSKHLKYTALMVAADLLYTSCVLSTGACNPDAQLITEKFLPLLVGELENAGSAADRLATILALGSLGVDDVLLLLVPYIRGEDVATRIAAILSLQRLMDSSSEKVRQQLRTNRLVRVVSTARSFTSGDSAIGFDS